MWRRGLLIVAAAIYDMLLVCAGALQAGVQQADLGLQVIRGDNM